MREFDSPSGINGNVARVLNTSKMKDQYFYEEATFYLNDDPSYKGYHIPESRWNGWAMPSFEKEEVIRWLDDMVATDGGGYWKKWTYSKRYNTFYLYEHPDVSGETEPYQIPPHEIVVDGKTIQVWDVSCSLVWDDNDSPYSYQMRGYKSPEDLEKNPLTDQGYNPDVTEYIESGDRLNRMKAEAPQYLDSYYAVAIFREHETEETERIKLFTF